MSAPLRTKTDRPNRIRIKSIEASLRDSEEQGRSLRRTLGTVDIAAMGIAVAVGAGIFSVGAQAAANFAGPSVILSFVLAAITCGLAIMCYAEFASTIPVAGSAYTFTYASMGELLAWIVGWDLILETLTAAAVIAKYWGIYLSTALDVFGIRVPATIDVGIPFTWGPVLVVGVFTVLLAIGTQLSSRVSTVITAIKILIVLFVIVVGALFVKAANFAPFIPPAQPTKGGGSDVWEQSLVAFATGSAPAQYGGFGLLAAASLVFFAFIGFDVVATSAEETKNPQKTLPKGIFLGLGVVTLLYVGVSIVLTGMVSYKDLAKADTPSLATAFDLVGQPWAAGVIAVGSLVGLTTVVMVLLLGLSRIVFSMSRDGLLPRWFSVTSKRGTPMRVQIVAGVVVAGIAGFTQVDALEGMINIGTLSAFVLVSIGIVVLRRSQPDVPRAFRVPWSPVLPILSAVLCVWLMCNLTTLTWVRFVVWLAVGMIVYWSYGRRHSRVGRDLAPAAALSAPPSASAPATPSSPREPREPR